MVLSGANFEGTCYADRIRLSCATHRSVCVVCHHCVSRYCVVWGIGVFVSIATFKLTSRENHWVDSGTSGCFSEVRHDIGVHFRCQIEQRESRWVARKNRFFTPFPLAGSRILNPLSSRNHKFVISKNEAPIGQITVTQPTFLFMKYNWLSLVQKTQFCVIEISSTTKYDRLFYFIEVPCASMK